MNESNIKWLEKKFNVDLDTLIKALKLSPSSQGYIQGALSEILLINYLENKGFTVQRIKEKPAGRI